MCVFHLPYFHSVFPFILHSLLSSFIDLFPLLLWFFLPYYSAFFSGISRRFWFTYSWYDAIRAKLYKHIARINLHLAECGIRYGSLRNATVTEIPMDTDNWKILRIQFPDSVLYLWMSPYCQYLPIVKIFPFSTV